MFSHSADIDLNIDFDDGWEEIIETGSSSCPSSDETVAYKQTEPTTTKRKSLLKLETVRKRIIVIVYLLVMI